MTDRIEHAHGGGSLDGYQWSALLDSAREAVAKGDGKEAVRLYLILYSDIVSLAQADLVLTAGTAIHRVTEPPDARKGVKPGLNFSLHESTEANGTTGYVNDQGEFGVSLSFKAGTPQPEVAIILFRNAFKPEKDRTLWVLRHEMMHAEHDQEASDRVEQWLSGSKAKAGKGSSSKAQFLEWLRKRRDISKFDLALIEESAVNLVAGSPNSEILSYVEGFMTSFHLTDPAPTDPNHPVFLELLGVLQGKEGLRWAVADPSVRSEALGRLQEYYCHALDRTHRDAFDAWVNHQLELVHRDQLASGESVNQRRVARRRHKPGARSQSKCGHQKEDDAPPFRSRSSRNRQSQLQGTQNHR